MKGANHFSFNNGFADNPGTRLLSGTEEQFEIIRRYSIAFLEKHVAGKQDAGRILERSDPMLTRYIRELQHYSLGLNRTLPGFETLAGLIRCSMQLHNAVTLEASDRKNP